MQFDGIGCRRRIALHDAQHDFPFFCEFNRIAEQIAQHFLQTHHVADELQRNARLDFPEKFDAFFMRMRRKHGGDSGDSMLQIEFFLIDVQLPGFDFREIENIAQQFHERVRRRFRHR